MSYRRMVQVFQSYNSSIQTAIAALDNSRDIGFQSYNSSIQTRVVLPPSSGYCVFQSYNSSIQTDLICATPFHLRTFNPIIVRFKHRDWRRLIETEINFQSYNSSIQTSLSCALYPPCDADFQSYNSSIQTS